MGRPLPRLPGADLSASPAPTPRVEVLGIRHHGPGSARSVAGALDELAPTAVVIEGPPELDALTAYVDEGLVPPVAGLAYVTAEPWRAAFYPMAAFSPEWVALRWAVEHDVPVRFADLPAANALAPAEGDDAEAEPERTDPITLLATTAGYDDPERWWEDAVEHRAPSSLARFALLREAMTQARAAAPVSADNLRREAAMRKVIRAVVKDGHERVAVVCGAYHAPVLDPATFPSQSADNKLLAGLPKVKVTATWAPWTAGRLAYASGYGAGVTSPGWYQHLFACWAEGRPDDVVPGWLTRVARALRDDGLDAAPATVVEAVLLAEALAAVRGRPSAGLDELMDASQTVLCGGSAVPLVLVQRRLVIGEELGQVPDGVPLVPLAEDLARTQRSLRMKPSPTPTSVTLDLRKEAQLGRSLLLHRLTLLGIPWGVPGDAGRTTGTFKEAWDLEWQPEFAVALIEAGLLGTTVVGAAEARVREAAAEAKDLATLGRLVEQALVADLPGALATVVDSLAAATAHQHDTRSLLDAVEPLARTQRYGDVRRADVGRVREVLQTVVVRACVELRSACAALDDDAAAALRASIDAAQRGIALVGVGRDRWREALAGVAADDRIHGAVAGRVNRILLDGGHLTSGRAAERLSRQLSRGSSPTHAAAWLDGFLDGEAVLLLHDPTLLALVDTWLGEVDESVFEDLLPLLRRTFSRFAPAERRQVATRVRHLGSEHVDAARDLDLAAGRAAALRVAGLLGLEVTR
ncbi:MULTISPECIES: DUF5682 family protein [unclassified Nocardioides]|uniref:DUF5682 family protein n=1 Tax=unclassified Nocardioides TaxID=2615069 RepID=UPI00191021AF|nr:MULTISPECIES: DUF5682 family protein [unclassified Nocardioides]